MAKWFVQRGEKEFGPFEDKQLKQLAESGKLKPIDVVRREDLRTGRPASEIKGLFAVAREELDLPDLPDTPSEPAVVVTEPVQAASQASTFQQMKESAATLTDYAKKQAKLKSLELSEIPSALNELGSKALEHGVGRDQFSKLYDDISQIDAQVSELRSNKPSKPTDTLTDKMKNVSVATVNKAKVELLLRNRKKLVTELGEKVSSSETVDPDGVTTVERQRVRDLKDQRDNLSREITDMDMGNKIKDGTKSLYTKRSILRPFVRHPAGVLVFLIGCFPIGLYLLWTNRDWSTVRRVKWTGAFCVVLLTIMAEVQIAAQRARKELALANQLWQNDDKAGAIAKYRDLVSNHTSIVDADERPVIYGKIIDFDAEAGNDESANKFIEQSFRNGVSPVVSSFQAKMLVSYYQARNESSKAGSAVTAAPKQALSGYLEKAVDKANLSQLASVRFVDCKPNSRFDVLQAIFVLAVIYELENVKARGKDPRAIEATLLRQLQDSVARLEDRKKVELQAPRGFGIGQGMMSSHWKEVFGVAYKIQTKTEWVSGASKPGSYDSWTLKCSDGLMTFTGAEMDRLDPPKLMIASAYFGEH